MQTAQGLWLVLHVKGYAAAARAPRRPQSQPCALVPAVRELPAQQGGAIGGEHTYPSVSMSYVTSTFVYFVASTAELLLHRNEPAPFSWRPIILSPAGSLLRMSSNCSICRSRLLPTKFVLMTSTSTSTVLF